MRAFLIVTTLVVLAIISSVSVRAQDAEINKSLQQQMFELQKQIDALNIAKEQTSVAPVNKTAPALPLERTLGVLSETIAKDDKALQDFKKLCEQSKEVCFVVSELWANKALRTCVAFNDHIYQEMSAFEKISDEQKAYYSGVIEQCQVFAIYEQLDEVHTTIKNAINNSKKKK